MDVGLGDVADPEMVFCSGPKILVDRSARADHQCFLARLTTHQVAGLGELGVEESFEDHRGFDRFCSLRTNLRPDQTSSIAQTLMSTSPSSKPRLRTTFSVRSVSTPELFLGQE